MEWIRYSTPSPGHPGMSLSPGYVCRDVMLSEGLLHPLSVFVFVQKWGRSRQDVSTPQGKHVCIPRSLLNCQHRVYREEKSNRKWQHNRHACTLCVAQYREACLRTLTMWCSYLDAYCTSVHTFIKPPVPIHIDTQPLTMHYVTVNNSIYIHHCYSYMFIQCVWLCILCRVCVCSTPSHGMRWMTLLVMVGSSFFLQELSVSALDVCTLTFAKCNLFLLDLHLGAICSCC